MATFEEMEEQGIRDAKRIEELEEKEARQHFVLHAFAERITLKGDASWAYQTLTQNNLPAPPIVVREATGKDLEETK